MPDNVRESIAAEVRAELARQQMSQRAAAEILGMPQPNLQLRLVGKRAFRAEELVVLATALGVPVAQFYGGRMPASDSTSAA